MLMLVFHGYGSPTIVHELVLEGSFERWLSIGYLHFSYVVMLVKFGRWFYIGHIPWFRNVL